jgi:hypothetical protein
MKLLNNTEMAIYGFNNGNPLLNCGNKMAIGLEAFNPL